MGGKGASRGCSVEMVVAISGVMGGLSSSERIPINSL